MPDPSESDRPILEARSSRPSDVRSPAPLGKAAQIAAFVLVAFGCSGPADPSVQAEPVALTIDLAGPSAVDGSFADGAGECGYVVTATARSGPGASARWTGGTLTFTDLETEESSQEEVSEGQVQGWFGTEALGVGQSVSASLSARRDFPFHLRHELRYVTAGQSKTTTHALTCSFVADFVSAVEIDLDSISLEVGANRQLNATVLGRSGEPRSDRIPTWSTSDNEVAEVSPEGVVTGVALGTATITAASEGKSAAAVVTVTPAQSPSTPVASVASVAISPSAAEVRVGATITFHATTFDEDGGELPGREVTWTTSDSSLAAISTEGVLTGLTLGAVTVTATSESRGADAEVTIVAHPVVGAVEVTPDSVGTVVGGMVTFTALVTDEEGSPIDGPAVLWSTTDPAIATVGGTGMVTGRAVGTVVVTAISGGKTGSATVTVSPPVVGSVTVSPDVAGTTVGGLVQLTAVVHDEAGAVIQDRSVDWSSSDPGVATVSAAGQVTGIAPGTADITATADDRTGTATVTISPPPVATTISVAPHPANIIVGDSLSFSALVRDQYGAEMPGPQVAWSSSNPAIATTSGTGLVSGVALGSVEITASLEGATGTATVTISPPPVVGSVTVTPDPAALNVAGEGVLLSAVVRDENGVLMQGQPIEWSSGNPAVATVAASGLVTGVAQGTAVVTASAGERSGTATVTVAPAVGSVTVSPETSNVIVGRDVVLSAVVRSEAGAVLDQPVVWSSSNPAIARVTSSGTVTGVAAGTATITATSGGRSGGATVTVISLGQMWISPASLALGIGESDAVLAQVVGPDGIAVPNPTVTWTSNDQGIATANGAPGNTQVGQISGRGAGTATVTASSGGMTATTQISVTATASNTNPVATVTVSSLGVKIYLPETTLQMTATLRDATGALITGRPITWSSDDPDVATVSPAGLITAITAGSFTVTATAEGRSGHQTVEVSDERVPASITVTDLNSHAHNRTEVGIQRHLSAVLRNSMGGVLGGVVEWTSSNPSVAYFAAPTSTVQQNGTADMTLHAVGSGVTILTATSGPATSSQAFWVQEPLPVDRIELWPAAFDVQRGKTAQASVRLYDVEGTQIYRPVTWATVHPSIATVGGGGVVSGISLGTTTLTAAAEGKTATATVRVVPPTEDVATVTVTPNPVQLAIGNSAQLTATLRGASGSVLTGRIVTWGSSNTNIATVGPTGLVTARAEGTATITATSEGRTGSAQITVPAPPPVGNTCAVLIQAPALLPGQSTEWLAATFPGSLDVRVMLGTMTAGAPGHYQYTLQFRNRYTQTLYFTYRFQVGGAAPTTTNMSAAIPAGGTFGDQYFALSGVSPVWVYVTGVRMGSSTAPLYCK